VFGNVAHARDRHVPGDVGKHPEHQEIVRLSECRHQREQKELNRVLRPDPIPESFHSLAERLAGFTQCTEELRLALFVAGLPRQIAEHLAPEAFLGDGKFGGETEIGIVRLLRAAMMHEMVMAITDHLAENRIGAQPLTGPFVPPTRLHQNAVGGVMHQDRETKLTAADDDDSSQECERVRPDRIDRHRRADYDPGMEHAERARDVGALAQACHLLKREDLGRIEALNVHG
jgi:hypothetical protein